MTLGDVGGGGGDGPGALGDLGINGRIIEGSDMDKKMWLNGAYKFTILYGSQTGTGKDVAEKIGMEALRMGILTTVMSMDGYCAEAKDKLKHLVQEGPEEMYNYIVFVAATTGDGEPPENMRKFWGALLDAKTGSGVLDGLTYGVIGLGDSSYQNFNVVGKKLDKRLTSLGGYRMLPVCLGDDQHDLGYHAVVGPWVKNLWAIMNNDFVFKDKFIKDVVDPSTLKVWDGGFQQDFEEVYTLMLTSAYGQNSNLYRCKVTENKRVTSESHWQDTRLITVDIGSGPCDYEPGDVLVVQPQNLPDQVTKFFQMFPKLQYETPVFFRTNPSIPWSNIPAPVMEMLGTPPWSWEKLVTCMFDIQSVPRMHFFEILSYFATDELEKEKLKELCSPEGQNELVAYCNRPRRTCLEALGDFPSTRNLVPKEYLFDLFGAIKTRAFSIASSKRQMFDAAQILVAVVEYQTMIKEKRRGLCSWWLAHHCPPGTKILVAIEKGTFKFPRIEPDNTDMPMIFVGPGTGIAPFRSFIQSYQRPFKKYVFFGCRNEKADFYFEEEWKELERQGLIEFSVAFSRDEDGKKREYVQDHLVQKWDELSQIILCGEFRIFVAGSANNMPKDVRNAFHQIVKNAGIADPKRLFFRAGPDSYQTETWS